MSLPGVVFGIVYLLFIHIGNILAGVIGPIAYEWMFGIWTTVVFGAETGGTVIWSFAGFEVMDEQWATALSLSFRVMAFSTLSLMFAFTTDPVKFIMSLMQQLKLSPKLAYGIMVGY